MRRVGGRGSRGWQTSAAGDPYLCLRGSALVPTRVLLCEPDPVLAQILSDLFAEEHLEVIGCQSLGAIEDTLVRYPEAVVVTEAWTDRRQRALSPRQQDELRQLSQRALVIVTTAHAWIQHVRELDLGDRVVVVPKPYDLDALVEAVRLAG